MIMNDEQLNGQFARYRRELFNEVRTPGPDAVRRIVFRRQRTRMSVLSVVAVVAVVSAVGQYLLPGRPGPGITSTTSPSAVSPTASPSAPSQRQSQSPSPSAASSTAPSTSVTGPPFPIVDGVDLHALAPHTVTLKATQGRYRGTVTVDAYDSGRRPYELTTIYVTLPPGVEIDYTAQPAPGFGPCTGAPPPETWQCSGDQPIPAAGGHLKYVITLNVAIAPQATAMTLDEPFKLRLAANDNSHQYPDPTPGDNTVAVTLVLGAK
jgi:hypothetical protein